MYSTIVSWRDRSELRHTIEALVTESVSVGGEVIVVNYGGNEADLSRQLGGFAKDVRVVSAGLRCFFNKPKAHNIGVFHSRMSVLFFCDCDILIERRSISSLAGELENTEGVFATLTSVKETDKNSRGANHITCFGYELHLRTADAREVRIVDNEENAEDGTRQAPGLLLVRRPDFDSVGGYNSRLHGWGWEDQDMICRLTLGAGLNRISRGKALHISHDDLARVQAYPMADRWESRDRMFRRALANYDRANFLGTYDLDVCELNSINS